MLKARPLVRCTLPLFVLTVVCSCRSPEEQELAAGRQALGRGAYIDAIRHYNEIVLGNPASPLAPRALYEVGVIYLLKLRDVEAAQKIFREVMSDYPKSSSARDARRMRARIYGDEQGELRMAIRAYEQLLDEYAGRDQKEIQLAIADYYYDLDEMTPAMEGYRRVVEDHVYDELSDRAYIRLAYIGAFQGQVEESLAAVEAMLARSDHPRDRRRALLFAADVRLASKRYDEVETFLERADREFPEDLEILERRARLTRQEQDSKPLDDGNVDSQALLEELQRDISWGRGKRTPRRR